MCRCILSHYLLQSYFILFLNSKTWKRMKRCLSYPPASFQLTAHFHVFPHIYTQLLLFVEVRFFKKRKEMPFFCTLYTTLNHKGFYDLKSYPGILQHFPKRSLLLCNPKPCGTRCRQRSSQQYLLIQFDRSERLSIYRVKYRTTTILVFIFN